MKRERAIDLAEHLLRNLDDGQETWPLSLVTAVYVFGSFARGALTPGDLDIDIEKTSDQQWSTHFVRSLSAGRDPFIPLRKALATGRRGYQFAVQYWDMEGRDFEMTLLWKRGDTLDAAMKRLHAIQIDPAAGRAERDSMLPEFEGIGDWIPRPYREGLCIAVGSGAIRIERLVLPDSQVASPVAARHIQRRWKPTIPCSALRRRWSATGSNGASTPDRATCMEPISETRRRLTSRTSTGPPLQSHSTLPCRVRRRRMARGRPSDEERLPGLPAHHSSGREEGQRAALVAAAGTGGRATRSSPASDQQPRALGQRGR